MDSPQKTYYERNKERIRKQQRQSYHNKKYKDCFFTIQYFEKGVNPFKL
jgi:hypothetical protein